MNDISMNYVIDREVWSKLYQTMVTCYPHSVSLLPSCALSLIGCYNILSNSSIVGNVYEFHTKGTKGPTKTIDEDMNTIIDIAYDILSLSNYEVTKAGSVQLFYYTLGMGQTSDDEISLVDTDNHLYNNLYNSMVRDDLSDSESDIEKNVQTLYLFVNRFPSINGGTLCNYQRSNSLLGSYHQLSETNIIQESVITVDGTVNYCIKPVNGLGRLLFIKVMLELEPKEKVH